MKSAATYYKTKGGEGAVREVADNIGRRLCEKYTDDYVLKPIYESNTLKYL